MKRSGLQIAVMLWGTIPVTGLLLYSIARLAPKAVGPIQESGLTPAQLAFALVWVPAMAYFEGYKGFQKAFSPRVVVRTHWVSQSPRPWSVALAPVLAMGFIHATRRRLIASWCLLGAIILFVAIAQRLPPGWRAVVDGGVVVGLTWGILAILYYLAQSLAGRTPDVPSDIPG